MEPEVAAPAAEEATKEADADDWGGCEAARHASISSAWPTREDRQMEYTWQLCLHVQKLDIDTLQATTGVHVGL